MVTARKRPSPTRSAAILAAESERDIAIAARDVAEAHRKALCTALSNVLDTIDTREQTSAEVQAMRRRARALIAEVGR